MSHKLFILRKSATRLKQRGVMLLEALIGILVFSLGILAMVGMQAVAIGHSGQSKYRADAGFAVNKLFASMWVDTDGNMSQYATSGTKFNSWKTDEIDRYLPGAASTATVTIATFTATPISDAVPTLPVTGYNIAVRIEWRAPNESSSNPPHVYQAKTTIVRNAALPPL